MAPAEKKARSGSTSAAALHKVVLVGSGGVGKSALTLKVLLFI